MAMTGKRHTALEPAAPVLDSPTPAAGRIRRWTPSSGLVRFFVWAAVISNGLIAVTGATVRVTGSGLGCATWPECQPGSLIPESRSGLAAIHQAIEFTNRTLTGVVLVASLAAFVLIWRSAPRRRQLIWLAAAGPIGVTFQAIWGGIVVYTGLRWWTVAPHLLASLVPWCSRARRGGRWIPPCSMMPWPPRTPSPS